MTTSLRFLLEDLSAWRAERDVLAGRAAAGQPVHAATLMHSDARAVELLVHITDLVKLLMQSVVPDPADTSQTQQHPEGTPAARRPASAIAPDSEAHRQLAQLRHEAVTAVRRPMCA
ncbi:hypothetical protein [Nonomuraea sp. KM90]|uniref:hypothetical protein n=1 Tax=Nonomuraea sp. KM90 TaxID=3457428 RepID=UPI003FCE8B92